MSNKRSSSASAVQEPMTDSGQEHPLAETGQEVGESAGHLAERAADVGFKRADQGMNQVASGIDQLAGSIRRVSTDMESEQPAIANAAMTAAEQADRLAGYLRNTDAREILRTVEDVARRQPILFLGGAFVAGLAASRFLKAAGGSGGSSDSWRSDRYGRGSYGDGYGSTYGTGQAGAYRATGPGAVGGTGVTTDEGL